MMLISLATFATASGQAPTWNPYINRQVEKYDNPPALIYRLDTSPRMALCSRDGTNTTNVWTQPRAASKNLNFDFVAKHRQNSVDKLTVLA